MSLSPLHLGPGDIHAGCDYLAVTGDWIFHVDAVRFGDVFYSVMQTGKRCECDLFEFATRVVRRLDYTE